MLSDDLLVTLEAIDTPTLCNAIEVAEGRRGFAAFTRAPVLASTPEAGAVVGRAVTARIRAAMSPQEPAEAVRARRMAYYRMMAEAPRPAIAVIEDEDEDGAGAVGAFWGEINATVHKGLGLAGALTNGLMRDLGDLPEGFPVLAGGVGPSHAFVHVTAIDVPVRGLGLEVMRFALSQVVPAVAIGLGLAWLVAPALGPLLLGGDPRSGLTYLAVALAFLTTGGAAALAPALRAASVDPIEALRSD